MLHPPLRLGALAFGTIALILLLGLGLWGPQLSEQLARSATGTPRLAREWTAGAIRTERVPSPTIEPASPARRPGLSPTLEAATPSLVSTAMPTPELALPSPTASGPVDNPTAPPTLLAPTPGASSTPPAPTVALRAQGLRDFADGFLIGFATRNDFWELPDATSYQALAASEFNILTPAIQMKWAEIHPSRNTYRFGPADQHVAFAERHGMQVHGHTLVWYSTNPTWLTQGTWSRQELKAILYEHIDQVVGHYRGRVAIWDVVNEGFNSDGKYRETLWSLGLGKNYIELAFERAHAADPGAILVYNDLGMEELNAKSDAVYAMAVDFRRRGVPLHGIGFQLHITVDAIDLKSFAKNMRRFAELGLKLYITEADVRLKGTPTAEDLQAQARTYQGLLHTCLEQPACKGFQLWGFTDKYSFIRSAYPGYGNALIFDEDYRPKPAYRALREELKQR
jgi:GH35 family endo-1,4-beta-xylanase